MANPKFIPVESKVLINARLPKSLTDQLEKYSEITGNTKTDIFTTALAEYFDNITVDNTYLSDVSGITLKIPFTPHQKKYCINHKTDLTTIINNSMLADDKFFNETFEILKIPNNLDIFDGETYKTDGISYNYNIADSLVNVNVVHSGIEFFIYPDLYETLIETDNVNAADMLYCFYFEVTANDDLIIRLIDYVTAINLLSKANNDIVKNLLISCYKDLDSISDMEFERNNEIESTFKKENAEYNNPYADPEMNVDPDILYDDVSERISKKYNSDINELINAVANKFNTGNIIKLGDDIDKRMVKPDDYAAIYGEILKSIYDPDDEIYKKLLKDAIADSMDSDNGIIYDKIEFKWLIKVKNSQSI